MWTADTPEERQERERRMRENAEERRRIEHEALQELAPLRTAWRERQAALKTSLTESARRALEEDFRSLFETLPLLESFQWSQEDYYDDQDTEFRVIHWNAEINGQTIDEIFYRPDNTGLDPVLASTAYKVRTYLSELDVDRDLALLAYGRSRVCVTRAGVEVTRVAH